MFTIRVVPLICIRIFVVAECIPDIAYVSARFANVHGFIDYVFAGTFPAICCIHGRVNGLSFACVPTGVRMMRCTRAHMHIEKLCELCLQCGIRAHKAACNIARLGCDHTKEPAFVIEMVEAPLRLCRCCIWGNIKAMLSTCFAPDCLQT